jgi:hypothetical protein
MHLAFATCVAADHPATRRCLLSFLALPDEVPSASVGNYERLVLGQIVDTVLTAFCLPEFVVTEEQGFRFLRCNVLIANLMDGCLQTTADQHIIKAHQQPPAAVKTTVLYSARNNQSVQIASLQRFLSRMHHRILSVLNMQELSFGCKYPGIPETRHAKELINHAIQKYIPAQAENRPVPDQIAVFSESCAERHSMHRRLAQSIAALKPHCHLTLMHSLRESHDLNTPLFHDVIRIPVNDSSVDISRISLSEFQVRSFLEVGMTLPSILMGNLHCAPLQVVMTSHPVSPFRAGFNAFISGRDVDVPMLEPQMYYEHLVLWPGYAVVHKLQTLPRQFRQKTVSEVINNFSTYAQKPHWHWLETVNAAIKRCRNRIRLRVFAGYAPINPKGYPSSLNPVSREMTVGGMEIVSDLAYPDYRTLIKDGDFAIDCYPVAGSNALADNLHLRKPSPPRERSCWFKRIAPATPRSAGNFQPLPRRLPAGAGAEPAAGMVSGTGAGTPAS